MLGEGGREWPRERRIRTLVGLEKNKETGWIDRLSWAGNVVAMRRGAWREQKLEEKRCTNTIYVEIVIDSTQEDTRR